MFDNATNVYHFPAKDSETKRYFYVKEIFQEISVNDMKKTRLNGCVYNFFIRYRAFGTSSIINIHKYLMKKHDIK